MIRLSLLYASCVRCFSTLRSGIGALQAQPFVFDEPKLSNPFQDITDQKHQKHHLVDLDDNKDIDIDTDL